MNVRVPILPSPTYYSSYLVPQSPNMPRPTSYQKERELAGKPMLAPTAANYSYGADGDVALERDGGTGTGLAKAGSSRIPGELDLAMVPLQDRPQPFFCSSLPIFLSNSTFRLKLFL